MSTNSVAQCLTHSQSTLLLLDPLNRSLYGLGCVQLQVIEELVNQEMYERYLIVSYNKAVRRRTALGLMWCGLIVRLRAQALFIFLLPHGCKMADTAPPNSVKSRRRVQAKGREPLLLYSGRHFLRNIPSIIRTDQTLAVALEQNLGGSLPYQM